MVKNPPADPGDKGSIPGSGRCPREGNGNPLQCSCLENPTDREAWRATVTSQTRLSTHAQGQDTSESHMSRRGSLRLNTLRAGEQQSAVGQAWVDSSVLPLPPRGALSRPPPS